MPPKTIVIRPGTQIPSEFGKADPIAEAYAQKERQQQKISNTNGTSENIIPKQGNHKKSAGSRKQQMLDSKAILAQLSRDDNDDDKEKHQNQRRDVSDLPPLPSLLPPPSLPGVTATPVKIIPSMATQQHPQKSLVDAGGREGGKVESLSSSPKEQATHRLAPPQSFQSSSSSSFDDDCDLCNEKVAAGELLTQHLPIEHSLFRAWLDTISSEEKIREFLQTSPTVSADRAREIGQLAIDIAKKKDGGPLVWNAALNVWKQIKAAVFHKTLELRVFGSCVAMGTWDGVGDVDLCFVRPAPKARQNATTTSVAVENRHSNNNNNDNDDDDDDDHVAASASSHQQSMPQYNMESVYDQKKEVHYVARCLRDAGFAFDDLEPVVHARVPIVKHHHSAPEAKDRSGWESIAERKEARTIVYRFGGGTKLSDGVVEMLANHAPGGHWENGKGKDFVLVNESTNAAVENYCAPWKYLRSVVENYEKELGQAISKMEKQIAENQKQQQQEPFSSPSAPSSPPAPPPPPPSSPAGNDKNKSSAALDKARKHLRDIELFTRTTFEHACRKVDWYSNKFFHFPEMFHCDFDLSFRAHGIRNSILLRAYFSQTPLARIGALLVKQWSKETAVNLSMRGYWTTYCVNIVWISFLIHKKIVKFVDPRSIPVFVTDEQFEKEIFQYIPTLGDDPSVGNDSHKIGSLLFQFFFYFGYEFDWSTNVVTLRQNSPFTRETVSSAKQPWTVDNEIRTGKFKDRVWYRLCVDDPYEENLSLGRHLSSDKASRILTHFRLMAIKLASSSFTDRYLYNKAPLLPSLKPDDYDLSPLHFRRNFVRWFVGHTKMPLKRFIQTFVASSANTLLVFGSANAFVTLSSLLEGANAQIAFEGGADARNVENAFVQHVNPNATYLSPETFAAIQEIEKKLFEVTPTTTTATTTATTTTSSSSTMVNPSYASDCILVTTDFAKQHKLPGNFVAPLKAFFDFTHMFGGNEFRIFRNEADLERFIASKKGAAGGAATVASCGANNSNGNNTNNNNNNSGKTDYRDSTRSWTGTCDDCGARQRRLYANAENKSDRGRYCDACWDLFEKKT